MTSPLVLRQIFPPLFPTTTTTTPPPPNPTTTSSTAGNGLFPPVSSIISDVSSLLNPSFSLGLPQSTSSLGPTSTLPSSPSLSIVPPVSPTPTPPFMTSGPNGAVTITETSSATAPPSSGTSEPSRGPFLGNKPLAGFVFGLVGLIGLVIVISAVTAYLRRRNRKRLLADASNFSFDPKDVEDRMSAEEKYPHSGLVGNSGHAHSNYPPDNGAASSLAGVGMGGVSRSAPPPSPPIPAHIPQDYAGYDGGYPAQYHNLSNVPAGYNQMSNPHDMYDPRNGSGYSHSHDPYNPIPRQLQPGLYPAQVSTLVSQLSTSPPPMNRSPPIPSTTSPQRASTRASVSNKYSVPRFPTSGAPPDPFGRHNSDGDDAYGGAFLGHDSSPPEPRPIRR